MKKVVILAFTFLSFSASGAERLVDFTISKPHCLFNFLQTLAEGPGTSRALLNYAQKHELGKDEALQKAVELFRQTEMHYTFQRSEYPQNRHSSRSTLDLIQAASIHSRSLDDFGDRILGMLPNVEYLKLMEAMRLALPIYDQMIWRPHELALLFQLEQLRGASGKMEDIFQRLAKFYRSSWDPKMPFLVSLYPIPGERGNTAATPFGNALSVGVLTHEKDHHGRLAVVIHEICHVLYNEQPAEIQHELDGYFTQHSSPYSEIAYSFFDEVIATACGNGWAYAAMTGAPDSSLWYDNIYINGAAKFIYPIVNAYLEQGKTMDSALVNAAIVQFETIFPKARYDAHILLNKSHLYHDAETSEERQRINSMLLQRFQMYSTHASSPIHHAISLEQLKNSPGTQVVLLHDEFEENLKHLQQVFPPTVQWLSGKKDDRFILGFFDNMERAVIILRAKSIEDLDTVIEALHQQQFISTEKPYTTIP